jgi:uncharacterized membrane protein YeiH
MIVAILSPAVLALFVVGWRQAIPQEPRQIADAIGLLAFGINAVAATIVHRRDSDWSVFAYVCLNIIPAVGFLIDLVAPWNFPFATSCW